MTFKERQIDIYNREKQLHKDTQVLLYDLLKSMTPDELASLEEFDLNEYDTISHISHELLIINNDMGDEVKTTIDYLTQIQQKELVDFIMLD